MEGTTSQNFSYGQFGVFPQEEMVELGKRQKQLVIGIPKENNKYESRIPLTPQAVQLLVESGHQIIIESGAGKHANYEDLQYSEAGAFINSRREEIYKSQIVLKVAPPQPEEIELLKGKQILISALNIATQNKEMIRGLINKKITALAFEHYRDEYNNKPFVRIMSEISGIASVMVASELLSNSNDGKGVLLGGITGISPTDVIILGAGIASEYAARAALGLGANIKVFDKSIHKLRRLQQMLGQRIFTSIFQPQVLLKALKSADVMIGAIKIGERQPDIIVPEDFIRQMKKGSVIVDLCIDSNSCFETSKLTNHTNPVFDKFGVKHYCVPNIAGRFARTASIALSNVVAPMLEEIGRSGGISSQLRENMGLRHGAYIYNGILTNRDIGKMFDIPSKDINLLMAAF